MTARRARTASWAALALLASGCATVHGERAVVAGVTKAEAAKVVKEYTANSNRANRRLDVELTGRIETGVLREIDQATVKAKRAVNPEGDPGYQPLALSGTRYLIPELRGWPKWFVADTANNRDGNRWLIAFSRNGASGKWKAAYLTVVEPGAMPRMAVAKDGHAVPVAADDRSLAVPPGELGSAYTRYLSGGAPGAFAPGPHTSRLREQRRKEEKTPKYVTQYADQPVPAGAYPPFALRTADGGALVLFTTRHSWKVTAATGVPLPPVGEYSEALLSGTPKRALTRTAVAEQVAVVARGDDEPTRIVNRILGIVSARGE